MSPYATNSVFLQQQAQELHIRESLAQCSLPNDNQAFRRNDIQSLFASPARSYQILGQPIRVGDVSPFAG